MEFMFKDVKEKEKRRYKKSSKYDPIIDAYIGSPKYKAGGDGLQKLEWGNDVDPSYLSLQVKKRIASRNLPIKVSVSNSVIYFEKVQ